MYTGYRICQKNSIGQPTVWLVEEHAKEYLEELEKYYPGIEFWIAPVVILEASDHKKERDNRGDS